MMNPNKPQENQREPLESTLGPNPYQLDPSDPNVTRDPVCGALVDIRTAPDSLAAPVNMPMDTVYFCSAHCKAIFEQDPEKYGSTF